MRKVYWQDRIAYDAEAAKLDACSSAAFYGKSVFTTIAIHNKKLFLYEKHWDRLAGSAKKLRIDISAFNKESLLERLNELISVNEDEEGLARITFFDGSLEGPWQRNAGDGQAHLLITTRASGRAAKETRLALSPYTLNSRSPLTGIKSGNYLENLIALNEAKSLGYDEAMRINERGEVTGCCMSNVFWIKNGEMFTPSLSTGCLPGTTREFILESLTCTETVETPEGLKNIDGMFLTSAGLGVARVAMFGEREFEVADHEIMNLLPF